MEASLKGRAAHTALTAISKKLQTFLTVSPVAGLISSRRAAANVGCHVVKQNKINQTCKCCQEILKTLLASSNYVHSQSHWFTHGGYESLLLPSNKEAGELMKPLNRRSFMQTVNSCWLKWIFKFSLFFLIAASPGLISHRPLCFCLG